MIAIFMFIAALIMLLWGFPVAFTFAGVALVFGVLSGLIETGFNLEGFASGISLFELMPFRIYAIMQNTILMAIPMFIFMGVILQKTGLANKLLSSMAILFGRVRGGIAISTILVGALLAASTGVVGASVVAMGVISLPVMMKYNYDKKLASGVICASGTLGQIIPPSIVLIILADVFSVSVGDMFKAALIPGGILVLAYVIYTLIVSFLNKDLAPAIPNVDDKTASKLVLEAVINIIPCLALIIFVLGSILGGLATPTESSAIGAIGSMILALFYGKLNLQNVKEAAQDSVIISSMVFAILIGATAFSMVFSYNGGDFILEEVLLNLPGDGKYTFIILMMIFILILGFFIDFIEISYIIVPLILPVSLALDIDPIWFATLIAMNLQTSFLTPPFGFALFYLKGAANNLVSTVDTYKGVIPFIILQILVLSLVIIFPDIIRIF